MQLDFRNVTRHLTIKAILRFKNLLVRIRIHKHLCMFSDMF